MKTIKLSILSILVILYFSSIHAEDSDSDFYAVTSLRCHLEQLIEETDDSLNIAFEDDDVETL